MHVSTEATYSNHKQPVLWMRVILMLLFLTAVDLVIFMQYCKPAPTATQVFFFTVLLSGIFIETIEARWYVRKQ